MKNLKILYIDEIEKLLPYTIHEIKKMDNGFYTLDHAESIVRKNYSDYQKNSHKKYCYVVTNENKILEVIYKNNIVELEYVVDNLYKFKKEENKIKTLKRK